MEKAKSVKEFVERIDATKKKNPNLFANPNLDVIMHWLWVVSSVG